MDHATESLARWRHDIFLVPQLIQNDVSSIKVRLFLRHGLSVPYLLPAPSVEYIEEHELYADDAASFDKKDKDQERVKNDAWKGEGNAFEPPRIASTTSSRQARNTDIDLAVRAP